MKKIKVLMATALLFAASSLVYVGCSTPTSQVNNEDVSSQPKLGGGEEEDDDEGVVDNSSNNSSSENSNSQNGSGNANQNGGNKDSDEDATLLNLLASTKMEGASFWLDVDVTGLGLAWAQDLEGKEPSKISLTAGNYKEVIYTAPNFTEVSQSFRILINMPDATVTTTKITVILTLKGTKYKVEANFVEGKYCPENYEVTQLTLAPSGKKLQAKQTLQFTVKDQYGFTPEVTWSATVGSIDETGLYTAPDTVATETTVTVTAKYSEEISGEITLTLIADDAELPKFDVNLNTAVNGAWIYIDVFYTDVADAITASNDSLTNVTLEGLDNDNYVGVASALSNGVRFGYGFANASFQAENHTLKFRITTTAGDKYDFTVEFTGTSGENVDMDIISCTFEKVEE